MSTSGKFLRCSVGAGVGTTFVPRLTRWNATETGETLDDTSAASNGYEDWSNGVDGVQIAVEFVHDVSDGAFPTMGKGTVVTNLAAWRSSMVGTPDYLLPSCIITDPGRAVEVRGQIRGNFTVRSKGPFYRDGVLARVS